VTGRSALAGPRRTLPELEDALFLDLGDVPRKMFRFWVLLVLSGIIATAGILADSTATVIGAMIIAPLGMPIMGAGLAVVTSDGRRVLTSAALAIGGAASVVLLGAVLAWAAPKLQAIAANGQVTSRTAPSIIDLIAAIATGFAGSYGLARRDISDIMPGVAIAISLVPPLAVAGITASAGDWASAWGALLLFAANVAAMLVAGTIVFTLYGYHRTARRAAGFRKRGAFAVIAAFAVGILVPLGLTTAQTAREQAALTQAAAAARPWAAASGYKLLDVRFEGPDLEVAIEGIGPQPPGGRLLIRLRGQVPAGTPVVVDTIAGEMAPIGRVPALEHPGRRPGQASPVTPSMSRMIPTAPKAAGIRARPCALSQALMVRSVLTVCWGAIR
jgi:uncharacterized hydrophobic protein (TIGR00271 family)